MANYSTSQRQISSGGSPYPTGRSPIVLGLEDSIASVTQDLVKARKEEIKAQRLEVDENEKLLLDALDLEPIEGMSDKVASDFVAGVDAMSDKYSRLLMERGGIFSREDKLNLAKEKRQLEKKLTIASSDIATLKQLKMEVAKPQDKSYVDNKETSKNIVDFEKKGLVGTGGAINLAVLKPQPFGEDWVAEITPGAEKTLFNDKAFSVTSDVVDKNTGKVVNSYDNSQAVGNFMQYAKQLPSYQRMYAQDPVRAEAFASAVAQRWTMKPVQTDFESAARPRATVGGGRSSSGGDPNKPIVGNYNWNLPAAQTETIELFHTTVEGVRRGDPTAIDRMITDEPGGISKIDYYVRDGQGFIDVYFNDRVSGQKSIPVKPAVGIKVPKRGDKAGAEVFYGKLYSYYPEEYKKGIEKLNIANYITPEPFEQGEISDTNPTADMIAIQDRIDAISGNKVKRKNKDELESLAKGLSGLAPGHVIKAEDRTSVISIDGMKYDLHDPANKFLEVVTQITSRKYELGGIIYTIPLNEEFAFVYDNPTAKLLK